MDVLNWYNFGITAVLSALAGISLYNLRRFARLPDKEPLPEMVKLVSVLVPARNEERCIEACVSSLCKQDWPSLEVIVLDDGSTDSTPEILRRLAKQYPTVTILQGTPLPDGWLGKPWACHQLGSAAKGDILIFTDADTVHSTNTVSRAVQFATKERTDLFSVVPYQVMNSFAENVVIPMVHVLYFAYLPNSLILNHPRVSLCAANGQFMCFTRQGYNRVGGHAAVKSSIVEDVSLAKAMKRAGGRVALVDGSDAVQCHMYTTTSDVIAGFSKNLFPAMGFNTWLLLGFTLHILSAYVLPVPMMAVGLVLNHAPTVWLALIQVGLAIAIRSMIAIRFRMPSWHSLLMPVSGLFTVVIAAQSAWWANSQAGMRWKGRSYSRKEISNA